MPFPAQPKLQPVASDLPHIGLDIEALWWEDSGSCPWLRIPLCVSYGTEDNMRTMVADVPGVFQPKALEHLYKTITQPGVVIVGHNVRKYDLDVLSGMYRRRMPAILTKDTMNDLKTGRVYRNTLRAQCEYYGIALKQASPDWKKIIQLDEEEWDTMVEYCENDVVCALQLEKALAADNLPVPTRWWRGKKAAA